MSDDNIRKALRSMGFNDDQIANFLNNPSVREHLGPNTEVFEFTITNNINEPTTKHPLHTLPPILPNAYIVTNAGTIMGVLDDYTTVCELCENASPSDTLEFIGWEPTTEIGHRIRVERWVICSWSEAASALNPENPDAPA
jgi:hypothetical protein